MGAGKGDFKNTHGGRVILSADTKAEAKSLISSLPVEIQPKYKEFLGDRSNKSHSFKVEKLPNGNYLIQGTVPGSDKNLVKKGWAVYYKEVDSSGLTVDYYKDSFLPDGTFEHRKYKFRGKK